MESESSTDKKTELAEMTLEDCGHKILRQQAFDDLHRIDAQEDSRKWPMRWTFLIVIMSLLVIVMLSTLAASIVLFILTRDLSLALSTFFATVLEYLVTMISPVNRFLFWDEQAYKHDIEKRRLKVEAKRLGFETKKSGKSLKHTSDGEK